MSDSEFLADTWPERFAARLPTTISTDPRDPLGILARCWPRPTTRSSGYATYGSGTYTNGEIYAHRISWLFTRPDLDEIPRTISTTDGPEPAEVDHLCGTPNCVNPLHLELVGLSVNRRRRAPTARPEPTACPHGHPYPANRGTTRTGKRFCRECGRQATRRWLNDPAHPERRAAQNERRNRNR